MNHEGKLPDDGCVNFFVTHLAGERISLQLADPLAYPEGELFS